MNSRLKRLRRSKIILRFCIAVGMALHVILLINDWKMWLFTCLACAYMAILNSRLDWLLTEEAYLKENLWEKEG